MFAIDNSRRAFLQGGAAALLTGYPGAALLAEKEAPTEELVPNIDQRLSQLSSQAKLASQFRGTTPDQLQAWQQMFSKQLRSSLGPHSPPKTWQTVVEESVELPDHRRDQLVLRAKGFPPLPVYLLSPKTAGNKPRPAVLAIHGHGPFGYETVAGRDDLPGVAEDIEKLNYDYGRQLARRGYVVAVPCLTPFGRRLGDKKRYGNQDPCAVTFVRMQLLGRVLMAENLRDCLWAFEMLARNKQVDAKRMGCVGLSYGGRMTMLTSSLEPRIRVASISGALNVMQERIMKRYSCGAQVIPGLLKYGDVPEISSLIAPRHCVWEIGSKDRLIVAGWKDKAIDRIKRAYQAAGAADHLLVDRFEGGHQWSGRIAYPLLEKVLGPV